MLTLAVMTLCPLLFAGLAPQAVSSTDTGEMHSAKYGVYISNPSPFALATSRLDLWVRDSDKTAHAVIEDIPKAMIPAHTSPERAVLVTFTDESLVLNEYVGVSVECDGIR